MSPADTTNPGFLETSFADGLSSPNPSDWTDQQFREAFESFKIPNEQFHHREHIRLAWIYSTIFPENEAIARMVDGIRASARHHGKQDRYHHTITLAWMRLVGVSARLVPRAATFLEFAARHPRLLNVHLLERFYSVALLKGDAARHSWLEPDLTPLP